MLNTKLEELTHNLKDDRYPQEYCGIRVSNIITCDSILHVIDIDDGAFDVLKKHTYDYTYAIWDAKVRQYKEVDEQTNIKIWILDTI